MKKKFVLIFAVAVITATLFLNVSMVSKSDAKGSLNLSSISSVFASGGDESGGGDGNGGSGGSGWSKTYSAYTSWACDYEHYYLMTTKRLTYTSQSVQLCFDMSVLTYSGYAYCAYKQ